MFGPYSFLNNRDGREKIDHGSQKNMVEVAVLVKIVEKLNISLSSSGDKPSCCLIAPYAAQVTAIKEKLRSTYENLTVDVRTIDGFQGSEADIIIISLVRSQKDGNIGFLRSQQRTNVALTRARHCLWIVGNDITLSKSHSVWEEIASDAKDRSCFFNADEDPEIRKAILTVTKELDELDDLLSEDSTFFKKLKWQFLFDDQFQMSFKKLQVSAKKKIIDRLLQLGNGWRPMVKVDRTCRGSSYIVKQFKVGNYQLVCSIVIVESRQALKVWDVKLDNQTAGVLKRIDLVALGYKQGRIYTRAGLGSSPVQIQNN